MRPGWSVPVNDARIEPGRLAQSLRDTLEKLTGQETLSVLPRILDACNRLFDLSGCGVLLEDPETGLRVGAVTGPISRALEETQARVGEGPCVDAFLSGTVIETEDLQTDGRWPTLVKELHQVPVHGVLGMPVHIDGIPVGSIDVFRDAPLDWDRSQRDALGAYSEVIGSLLETVVRLTDANETANQLREALEARVVIERAVGFLMCRDGIDASAAFAKLRIAARSRRRKVRELAADFLAGDTDAV